MHYRVHNRAQLTLSWVGYPVQTATPYLRPILILSHLHPGVASVIFHSSFPTEILFAIFISLALCVSHPPYRSCFYGRRVHFMMRLLCHTEPNSTKIAQKVEETAFGLFSQLRYNRILPHFKQGMPQSRPPSSDDTAPVVRKNICKWN